ncbi:MAG: DUF86 domain-containing protein [Clostridia bacterium]|nr:DUF86 domain-containing protein [Clostridia bacterium]
MQNRSKAFVKSIIKYCEDVISLQGNYGADFQIFLSDKGYQYSLSFCIEQIGEIAKKLRDLNYKPKYPQIPWDEICAIRNRIAHGYDAIDLEMVFDICTNDVPVLLAEFKDILKNEE